MKKLVIVAIALMLLAGSAFAANTATIPVNITLVAGGIQIESVGNGFSFANVTLTGLAQPNQPTTTAPTLRITDLRGATDGWNVEVNCPNLKLDGTGTGDDKTLVFQGKSTPANCTVEQYGGIGQSATELFPNVQTVAEADLTTAQKIIIADENEGMGSYNVALSAADYNIDVKAVQYAGAYSGTFTADLYEGN